jgi:[ribosomal protein S5]-alanine N-acetyltransferase
MDDRAMAGGVAELETKRLRLRRWQIGDAEVRLRLWAERDPRVPAHRRISADGRPTLEDIENRIRRENDDASPGLLAAVRKDTGDVVGYCGLVANSYGQDGEPELAFEFLRAQWGRGLATESARAVVDWAKAAGYGRLWATVREWNTASRHVLAKLGFEQTTRVEPDSEHGDTLFFTKRWDEIPAAGGRIDE